MERPSGVMQVECQGKLGEIGSDTVHGWARRARGGGEGSDFGCKFAFNAGQNACQQKKRGTEEVECLILSLPFLKFGSY